MQQTHDERDLHAGDYTRTWERIATQAQHNRAYTHKLMQVLSISNGSKKFVIFLYVSVYSVRRSLLQNKQVVLPPHFP